jgi:hypothetical protein
MFVKFVVFYPLCVRIRKKKRKQNNIFFMGVLLQPNKEESNKKRKTTFPFFILKKKQHTKSLEVPLFYVVYVRSMFSFSRAMTISTILLNCFNAGMQAFAISYDSSCIKY